MIGVALLALLIGVTLGLLGGGGSILAVPVLTYAAGLSAKAAIASSLLVVGTTAVFALIPYARASKVDWRIGSIFSATAMVGAYAGGRLSHYFSGRVLLLLFAAMMVATAIAMIRGERSSGPPSEKLPEPRLDAPGDTTRPSGTSALLIVLEGLVVGAFTGLVGAGGGFLVVPALVLLGKLPMHRAVGTSLLVIALKSFAAFAGHAAHVQIDPKLTAIVTLAAVLGSFVGARIANRMSAQSLRRGFAVFVLVMASYVISRESGVIAASCVGLGGLALAGLSARRTS